jgi:hypothetical protein
VPIEPQHLLDQADNLAGVAVGGRPRGADLRRAISSAYYALFHFTMRAVADSVVPISKRSTLQYARVYRAVDHKTLRDVCKGITNPTSKYTAHSPTKSGFGSDICAFATAVFELQEKRHLADYDPLFPVTKSDALLTISTARTAITRFGSAPTEEQEAFLSLLTFPPR